MRRFLIIIFLALSVSGVVLMPVEFLFASDLTSLFTIKLSEKDRVLGSLRGNILVYGRPMIKMYDDRGRQLFSRKLKNNVKPVLSLNGEYVGLVTYADKSPTDLKTARLEIFDSNMRLFWKALRPEANTFLIADNGVAFGIEGVEGMTDTRIHIYDRKGNKRQVIKINNYQGITVSSSGTRFAVSRGNDGIDLYDSTGNVIATVPPATNYAFDADDQYWGTFSGGLFHFYQEGKEISIIRSSEKNLVDLAINRSANLVAFLSVQRLEVFDLMTGKLLWEAKLAEEDKSYTSLDIPRDGKGIVCGVDVNRGNAAPKETRHVEGYLYVYSIDGGKIIRRQETYTTWGVGLPRVACSLDGSIVLQTREKIEKFGIKWFADN